MTAAALLSLCLLLFCGIFAAIVAGAHLLAGLAAATRWAVTAVRRRREMRRLRARFREQLHRSPVVVIDEAFALDMSDPAVAELLERLADRPSPDVQVWRRPET